MKVYLPVVFVLLNWVKKNLNLSKILRIVAILPSQQQPGAGAFSPAPARAKKSGAGQLRLHNTAHQLEKMKYLRMPLC